MSFVRVKQLETGHELSVDEEWAERFSEAYDVLRDEHGEPLPGRYPTGELIPPKYHVSVDEAAASKVAAGEKPYLERRKADLEKEIADRNEGRPEDQLIVPDAPANKPELAAALEADDTTSPIADPPDGQPLTSAGNTTTEEN